MKPLPCQGMVGIEFPGLMNHVMDWEDRQESIYRLAEDRVLFSRTPGGLPLSTEHGKLPSLGGSGRFLRALGGLCG